MMKVNLIKGWVGENKWLFILIFCIAFFSDDSYWAATSGISYLSAMRYAFVVFLPVIYVLSGRARLSKHRIKTIILLTLMILIVSVFNGSSIGGPLMLFFCVVSMAFVTTKYEIEKFADVFCTFIILIIIYSFAVQMLLATGVLVPHEGENTAEAQISISGGCIFFQAYFGVILRNSAFFREPGVFMVYINIAYILDIWINKNNLNLKKQLVYFLGNFSTLSTAGMIIWALLFFTNLLRTKSFSIKNIVTMAIVVAVALIIFQNEDIYGSVFAKLDKGTESGSVLGRLSSIFIPLKMVSESPIWGWGTNYYQDEYIRCAKELYHTSIDPQYFATNTILNAAAVYGLWYGLFLLYGFYMFSKKLVGNNVLGFWLTFICLLMTFSNESMPYSLITYVLIFYGMKSYKVNLLSSLKQ